MQKRTKKKKIVSAVVIIGSVYTSLLFTIGLILGYLGTRYFWKKYTENGPAQLIYVSIRGWKIHLHHWLSGSFVLLYLILGGWQFESHKIFLGILCGIIAHDIYDFNEWHKIAEREKIS